VTLWKLPDAIEEEFDARWEFWLDQASEWNSFFDRVAALGSTDLVKLLRNLELASDAELDAYGRVRRSAEGRAFPLPAVFGGTDSDISLLALSPT
jgi:hypothetical protein